MRIFSIFSILCCLFLAACTAGSDTNTLDPDKADTKQTATLPGQIDIPVGTPAARVAQFLGPADSTDSSDQGRQIWRYVNKRAEYVYFSNTGNVQTLVLGKYSREGGEGLPLLLTLVFDSAGKLIDFNFAQLGF